MARPLYPGAGSAAYLPRWLDAASTSGGLTGQFLHKTDGLVLQADQWVDRLLHSQWLPTVPLGLTYREWTCPCPFPDTVELQLTLHTPELTGTVRRATSSWDFDTSPEPVWWLEPQQGRIRMRNLAAKETAATSATGVYTISGETSGLVRDEDLYYHYAGDTVWLRVPCETVSGTTLAPGASGSIVLRYPSQSLLVSLSGSTVQLRGTGFRTPHFSLQEDWQPNLLDGYGALSQIPRLDGEDNVSYRARLLADLQSPPDTTISGVSRAVGLRLGQLTVTQWSGVETLSLDPSGSGEIRDLVVLDVPRVRELQDDLVADPDDLRYYAYCGGWRQGYLVLVNGVSTRDFTLSGNVVTFHYPVTGQVTAEYSFEQYTVTEDASGNILSLNPGTGLPSGSYTVIYTQHVRVHGVDQPEFQRDYLLTPEGLPNRLYRELAHTLAVDNPTVWSRARWGRAYWLSAADDQPSTNRLLVAFDDTG